MYLICGAGLCSDGVGRWRVCVCSGEMEGGVCSGEMEGVCV